jgi:thymidine phosphorylase
MHGEGATLEEILDWRPYSYFTVRTTLPNGLSATTMEELIETDGGTHLVVRVAKPRSARDREVFASMSDMIAGMYSTTLAQLANVLAPGTTAESAADAGATTTRTISA